MTLVWRNVEFRLFECGEDCGKNSIDENDRVGCVDFCHVDKSWKYSAKIRIFQPLAAISDRMFMELSTEICTEAADNSARAHDVFHRINNILWKICGVQSFILLESGENSDYPLISFISSLTSASVWVLAPMLFSTVRRDEIMVE